MYYIHNFFTQHVILLNIAVKDHNKTEVELAKTSLETTRLLKPVYIEKRILPLRKQKNAMKNVAETTVRMCSTNYMFLKILENSQENTCVSF